MKKYDYNYSVVGVRSLLPMYITFEAENREYMAIRSV